MKVCVNCGMKKKEEDFYKKGKNGQQSWCKGCVLSTQKIRWKQRKLKAVKLMGGKCKKCGYDRNLAALDFHHTNPEEKEYNFNRLVKKSWNEIVNELKKCILLCKTCHSEIHHPDLFIKDLEENFKETLNTAKCSIYLKPTGKCLMCNNEVYGTIYCSNKCRGKDNRKVSRPDKEVLRKEIEESSYSALGRKYGVSDNSIRKWAKSYNLI